MTGSRDGLDGLCFNRGPRPGHPGALRTDVS